MTHPSPRRIAICGLVRDCKNAVSRNWEQLRQLESNDLEISWVFVENDSVDGSREWLDELARHNSRVTVLGENIGESTIPATTSGKVNPGFSIRRISKMAFFRNIYLDWLKEGIGLDNLDAVIVVDFDVYSLPVERLRTILTSLKPDSVVTALGTIYKRWNKFEFYDCYAYRGLGNEAPQTIPEIEAQRKSLWKQFIGAKQSVRVNSNFNGCAVYPAATLRDVRYIVLPNDDPEVECFVEHVGLHSQMTERGIKIVLDPGLRVHYETFSSYWLSWLGRRFRFLRSNDRS